MLVPILTFITGIAFGIVGKIMYDKSGENTPTPENPKGGVDPDRERKK